MRPPRAHAGRYATRTFAAALAANGITAVQLPHRSPNLNAYVERLIQSVQAECLDHFVVLGTWHLEHLLAEYIDYHNRQRHYDRKAA